MTTRNPIRIGTRGSELALAQAALFETALRAAHPDIAIERMIIRTTGDQRQDVRLADLSGSTGSPVDKGIFTKELESALRDGRIDIAVHSLKDVPTEVDAAFAICGAMTRAMVEDVLLSPRPCPRGIAGLPAGATVATSSVRRQCQLLAARPDLHVHEIRGNVPTRMRKVLGGGHGDALLLARAGLERLGWDPASGVVEVDGQTLHAVVLAEEEMFPAAGQGAVGLETRAGDTRAMDIVRSINHAPTWARVRCERGFLHLLKAGCHTPVGIITRIEADDTMRARALVFDPTGATPVRLGAASGPADAPESVAAMLFSSLAHAGHAPGHSIP